MEYKKIKSYQMTEAELRQLWEREYCSAPVCTFDGISVAFHSDMFDHAFFESANRLQKDKSILSLNRCEKMLWIKATLQDPDAALRMGWDTGSKTHDATKRVALVKGNYVVVILIFRPGKARFITAFQMDDNENLQKLLSGPIWPA